MRVINQITQIPNDQKTVGNEYPFGATIKNQTETERGTPVVEEIYGDIITNLYNVLQKGLVEPNGLQDTMSNGFQLVKALQQLPNLITDVLHPLNKSGNTWNIAAPVSGYSLVNFVFKAVATENYVNGVNYLIRDSLDVVVSFSSPTGFRSGDPILLVHGISGVLAYNLNTSRIEENTVYTVLGAPLSYNSSSTMYYEYNGTIITDTPTNRDLQGEIRYFASNSDLNLHTVFCDNNYFIAIMHNTVNDNFELFLASVESQGLIYNLSGSITFVNENEIKFYYSEGSLYMANDTMDLTKYNVDYTAKTYTLTATTTLDASFELTTNTVIKNNKICTLVNGRLNKYSALNGEFLESLVLTTVAGNIFNFKNLVYFTSGEVGKLWHI